MALHTTLRIVTSQQGGYQFTGAIPLYVMGSIVVESVVLELGPVLTGLALAGRVGANIAAELGTMRVTEQIDALYSLGADPVRYLVTPRVLASFIMVPVLVLYGDIIGIASGYLYNLMMGVNRHIYLKNTLLYLEFWDVLTGLIKACEKRPVSRAQIDKLLDDVEGKVAHHVENGLLRVWPGRIGVRVVRFHTHDVGTDLVGDPPDVLGGIRGDAHLPLDVLAR